jgi:hypothetical protein
MRRGAILFAALAFAGTLAVACGRMEKSSRARPGDGAVIYPASVITMDESRPTATAVAVKDGNVLAVGDLDDIVEGFSGAEVDETFGRMTILPGLIDPHVHMALSSLMYATETIAPWPIDAAGGGAFYPDRISFLARLAEIEAAASPGTPLVVWGYHDLVHGALTRADLDAITTTRPLIIWHYSGHDFYLNSTAIEWAKITGDLRRTLEGVAVDGAGEPTGRIFEDAVPYLMQTLGPVLLDPARVKAGFKAFSRRLNEAGVTTVADLAYGLFGLSVEDANIAENWVSPEQSGYRAYLVPEHRAFAAGFGERAVETVLDMASGKTPTPAPVLPQMKFFTDGAFYSQTMRISDPGYLGGQSKGSKGLWVTHPNAIAETIKPYWDAGLGVRIHSNGDEAQDATLDALETLRASGPDRRFVIEHAGLFSPEEVRRAGVLGATVSAASHYVFHLGEAYQEPLGPERGQWISPLASMSAAGIKVSLHSDAPLAPPAPLRAASVHLTRATREGGGLTPAERLSPQEALEAITVDAAYALGLEAEIGSIAAGRRADFTILERNPLATAGENWSSIPVWGVVLGGEKRPLNRD